MSGPTPKPRDQRARRNKDSGTASTSVALPTVAPALPDWVRDVADVRLDGEIYRVPKPPSKLLKQSVEAWVTYWTIPETSMIRPHHLPALRRLVRLYDEEERIRRRVAATRPVPVEVPVGMDGDPATGEQVLEYQTRMANLPGHLAFGSAGQVVESPDFKALTKTRERIQALEDRFAATPLAEFRVGWQRAEMFNAEARAAEAQGIAAAAAQIAERHGQLLEGTA